MSDTFKSMKLLYLQLTNFSRVSMKLGLMIIYYTMLKPFKMKIFFTSYNTTFFFFTVKKEKVWVFTFFDGVTRGAIFTEEIETLWKS